MTPQDPRVNPKLAVDLASEEDKRKAEAELREAKRRAREERQALAWYKSMRRSLGQRDRFRPFLQAEIRRRQREGQ